MTKEAFDALVDVNTDGTIFTPFGSTDGEPKPTSEVITDFVTGVVANKANSNVSSEVKKSPVGKIVTEGVVKGVENVSKQQIKNNLKDEKE